MEPELPIPVGTKVFFPSDGDYGDVIGPARWDQHSRVMVRWTSGLETAPKVSCLEVVPPIDGYFMRPADSATVEQK